MKAKKYWIFGLVVAAFTVVMYSTGECATKGIIDNIVDTKNYNKLYDVGGKPFGTDTLAGLTSICIVLDVSDAKLIDRKFDERKLYGDIQKKIRLENIRTLLPEEIKKTSGAPILNIRVKAKSISDESCAYSVSISLLQAVILNRDPNTVCLATTWYIPELPGCASKQKLVGIVKHLVKEGVEVFTLEYMAANLPAIIEAMSEQHFSDLTVQETEEALKKLEKVDAVLIVAAFHGFKKRINITTGEEREKAKKSFRWAKENYEQWKSSTQNGAEALIMQVTKVGIVAETLENIEVAPGGRESILKDIQYLYNQMQSRANYAKERIKSIRELEIYEGEFAEIREAYQKLSDATEVVIKKLKKTIKKWAR